MSASTIYTLDACFFVFGLVEGVFVCIHSNHQWVAGMHKNKALLLINHLEFKIISNTW